ncbi:hypothetical protein SCYAM73S_00894 [Streptomyces cyaneofuscatus]
MPASIQQPRLLSRQGDRIGLVGRNGAGKTTLTKCLAGEGIPAGGTITRSGEVGYLPQDPRTGDLDDPRPRPHPLRPGPRRVLIRKMRENEERIANGQGATREKAIKKYERQETEFLTKGGYAAEGEAATIAAALNLPDRVLDSPCTRSPVVSAAVSSWPGSCSPTRTRCCSTSPRTTSTRTRSSGCATT